MTNLDSILKSRDITLPTKVRLVKAMVFPVVMYGCESWTVKKAERQKIDAFELWCWRRLLRVPWTAGRSNQSIKSSVLVFIGLMLKLKYSGHLMWRVDLLEKILMLQGIGGRRRGWQRMRWRDGITDSMGMSLSKESWWCTGRPDVLGSQRVGHDRVTELNWIISELNWIISEVLANKSFFCQPSGLWGLSSPTRDWTRATAMKAQNPKHGPPGIDLP